MGIRWHFTCPACRRYVSESSVRAPEVCQSCQVAGRRPPPPITPGEWVSIITAIALFGVAAWLSWILTS